MGSRLVSAELSLFPFQEIDQAKLWILGNTESYTALLVAFPPLTPSLNRKSWIKKNGAVAPAMRVDRFSVPPSHR